MNLVKISRRGPVAVLAMNYPPMNALAHSLRKSLATAIDRIARDSRVDGLVLTGSPAAFSTGADITEFETGSGWKSPTLLTLIDLIEASAKPIVAAIQGHCLGGGLELALACHARVAASTASVGLPEVRLGIIPGAGGTQRLPRLAGIEVAVNLATSGKAATAASLAGTRLFDAVVATDPVAEAVGLVAQIAAGTRPRTVARDLKVADPAAQPFLQFARTSIAATSRGSNAARRAVDAIAASLWPRFDAGVAEERRLFDELAVTPEAKALQHVFLAERRAARIDGIRSLDRVLPIAQVAIVGAGTMGRGIAMALANAGLDVTLCDQSEQALQHSLDVIRGTNTAAVARGKLSAEHAQACTQRVRTSRALAEVGSADLVIEAVYEDMAIKRAIFRDIDRFARRGAILASNTSTLDLDELARATRRPADVIGLHFFSPAQVMPLLEIVRGRRTSTIVLATALALARRIRKTAVVARVCDGFIGNRMIEPYVQQALHLLLEGATPSAVDRAIERFGFAMGPFRMSDLAGNDIAWHVRKKRPRSRAKVNPSRLADQICEQGRFGQKTGLGWYRYEAGDRKAIADPAVDELIAAERVAVGIAPRDIAEGEIVDRLLLALVNEGARLLDEGIAQRASDIDVVYVKGYGFPAHRGGPMFHAERMGLFNVLRRMREFSVNPHSNPRFWRPAPLLVRAADRETFDLPLSNKRTGNRS